MDKCKIGMSPFSISWHSEVVSGKWRNPFRMPKPGNFGPRKSALDFRNRMMNRQCSTLCISGSGIRASWQAPPFVSGMPLSPETTSTNLRKVLLLQNHATCRRCAEITMNFFRFEYAPCHQEAKCQEDFRVLDKPGPVTLWSKWTWRSRPDRRSTP